MTTATNTNFGRCINFLLIHGAGVASQGAATWDERMAVAHLRISQRTLLWAGTVSYSFIMVSGAGLESLALRFIMASPA